jgi:glycosyltransferase involved in cell wall biosynthesis
MATAQLAPPAPRERGNGLRPLRIAVVAPPWFDVPPPAYGGVEAMLGGLVDTLVARGHHVTLIGAGENGTTAQRFHATYPEPPSQRLGEPLPEVVHAAAAARILADLDVDVVHDNTLAGPLLGFGRATPTVVTAHGSVTGEPGRYLRELGTSVDLVAISDAQRRLSPELNWVDRVHNAVDVASFPYRSDHDGYLLFLGRFSPDKGAHLAIDAARAAGRDIVVAGKRNEPGEHAYFDEWIRPRLGHGVTYVGEADATTKRELYAGAAALLFPVCWDEPFGMVMIEAMACGTPVVALRRGSVPEVVADGETGVIVDHPGQFVDAIGAAEALDRSACRAHVERHFDLAVMADGYESVYRTVTDTRKLREHRVVVDAQGQLSLD